MYFTTFKKISIFLIVNTCALGFTNAKPSTNVIENAYSFINQRGELTNKQQRVFFPLGIYSTFTDESDLKIIKSLGLNTITSYNYGYKDDINKFIKNSQNNGLYVIISLKDFYPGLKWAPKDFDESYIDRFLTKLQHKENIIGFNINDELSSKYSKQILGNYIKIRKNGYNQAIIQVLSEKQEKLLPLSKNSADVLSIDSYPIGLKQDLSSVAKYVSKVKNGNPRSTWGIIQIMSWSLYRKGLPYRLPTTEEIKNQAYQAIIAGANGILFYSYNDLFYKDYGRIHKDKDMAIKNMSNLRDAIPEIENLIRISLSAKNYHTFMSTDGSIVYKNYYTKNEKWLAIANTSYKQVEVKNKELKKQLVIHADLKSNGKNIYIPPLYSNLINISN